MGHLQKRRCCGGSSTSKCRQPQVPVAAPLLLVSPPTTERDSFMAIKIDPEIEALWRPLDGEELAELAADLKTNGCISPLVTWNETLLDGHHRFRICQKYGIGFRVKNLPLPDRAAALEWILRNQNGRRNATPSQKAMAAAKVADMLAEGGKARRIEKLQKSSGFPVGTQNVPTEKAASKAAHDAGVSPTLVKQAQQVEHSDREDLKADVKAGKKSVGAAVKELKEPKAAKPPEPVAGPTDTLGIALPDKQSVKAAFARLGEVKGLQREASTLKGKLVEAAARKGDPIFAKLDVSAVKADLEHVFHLLKAISPYAVCPYCMGGDRGSAENCMACEGRGWLSEYAYRKVPKELQYERVI